MGSDTRFSFDCVTETSTKDHHEHADNKAPEYDKISVRVIKACLPSILPVISNLFNFSFSSACFTGNKLRSLRI